MSDIIGETKLSCREAQLILRVMDISTEKMKDEEIAACQHYTECETCKKVGLSEIVSENLSCQQALEIWAAKPGPLFLGVENTALEQLAVEHVWGRTIKKITSSDSEPKNNYLNAHFGACQNSACSELRYFWEGAPFSSAYDGEKETAKEIPFLIKTFVKEKRPLTNLLGIQRQRVVNLLKALARGEIHADDRIYYHRRHDIIYEIEIGIQTLHDLLLEALPS